MHDWYLNNPECLGPTGVGDSEVQLLRFIHGISGSAVSALNLSNLRSLQLHLPVHFELYCMLLSQNVQRIYLPL